jgi:hypothetical protein
MSRAIALCNVGWLARAVRPRMHAIVAGVNIWRVGPPI